jgi:hypothetical protein
MQSKTTIVFPLYGQINLEIKKLLQKQAIDLQDCKKIIN